MKNKQTVVVATVSIIAGVITFVLVQQVTKKGVKVGTKKAAAKCNDKKHAEDKECKKAPEVKPCAGKPTPECLAKLDYTTTEGGLWTQSNLTGKVVMVNFWATWCKPCIHEIPALTKVYEKYKDKGFVLLGVMLDSPSKEKLQAFSLRTGLDYPVVQSTEDIASAFERPRSIPTTFVYDRGGNLRFRQEGPVSAADLEKAIAELVGEKAPK